MKKQIFTFLLAVASFGAWAQKNDDGVSFGIRAGVNFQNINGKDADGNALKNKILPGFNAGVTLDIPLVPDFYLQTGLLFSTKGAKINGTDSKLHLSYLELPVNFLYKPLLGSGHLLLGFGPYLAYGVSGKITSPIGDNTVKFKSNVSATDPQNNYYVKPLDAGANLLFGYEFSNHISLQLNAQLGLVNIAPSYDGVSSTKATLKNTGFGLSAGYRF